MQLKAQHSTPALVVGMLLTPLGLFLLRHAERARVHHDLYVVGGEVPEDYITVLTLGVIALVVGASSLLLGVVRLSRNVDLAALAAVRALSHLEPEAATATATATATEATPGS